MDKKDHEFYRDPLTCEGGKCDYTFPDGDYCGLDEPSHNHKCTDECSCMCGEGRGGHDYHYLQHYFSCATLYRAWEIDLPDDPKNTL